MKVSVIRHWEVDYKWSAWCTSDEFDRDSMGYNEAPIKHMSCSLPDKEYQKVYVSTLSRSRNTAIELFGNRLFHKTDLIDEVPLKSGFDTGKKLPLWFWNISGRFQWFINSPRQTEGRFCTRKRAEQFVAILCKEGGDCAVGLRDCSGYGLRHSCPYFEGPCSE